MPVLIAWLLEALETSLGSIVISALLTLGVSTVTYTFTVAPFRTMIADYLGGLSGTAINILGFLGVDQAITMILSALAAKFAVDAGRSFLQFRKK